MPALITASELADLPASDASPIVRDVRCMRGGTPGDGEHLAGHLGGAGHADLDGESTSPGEPADGVLRTLEVPVGGMMLPICAGASA